MPKRLTAALTLLLLPLAGVGAPDTVAVNQALLDRAMQRWETSPYGPMLARILPPAMDAAHLPDPRSRSARLLGRYCVQCHHLPNPAMHAAEKWPKVVHRMVERMRGRGNLGPLMKDMMGELAAPGEEELHGLLAYLRRHAQQPLDPRLYPDLATRGGSFREACSQCHGLPDPRSRSAREWPDIVARMERNMAWMNRVVGSKPDPREPQLRVGEILDYLRRYAPP
jgi:hypothetical protein